MTALLILLTCLAATPGPTRRLPPSGVLEASDALMDVARFANDPSPQGQLNLRKLLGHPAPEVRAAVLHALAAAPGIDSHVVAVYAEDESAEVRVAALAALSPRRDPVARAAVATHLSDGVVEVRVAALAAAGRMRDPALLPLLQILAEDRDAEWRAATATALGALGDPAAVPFLRQLATAAARGRTAQAAINALGALAHPSAAWALSDRLANLGANDPLLPLIEAALLRLGEHAEPALIALLAEDRQPLLLARVIGLLAKVGGPAAVPALAQTLAWSSPAVPAAFGALGSLHNRGLSLAPAQLDLQAAAVDPSQTIRALAAPLLAAATR